MEDISQLLEEIEQDRQVDPDSLDVEWLDQANLYYKYSNALNDVINERNSLKLEVDRLKEELEKISSQLDLEIRADPDAFGIPKVTESTVKSAVLLDKRYNEAFTAYMEARENLNQAQNLVNRLYTCTNTMEERKTSLEYLVKLINQQYFSTPSAPRDLSEEYHKKVNKNKKEAKDKVKQRKRKES